MPLDDWHGSGGLGTRYSRQTSCVTLQKNCRSAISLELPTPSSLLQPLSGVMDAPATGLSYALTEIWLQLPQEWGSQS